MNGETIINRHTQPKTSARPARVDATLKTGKHGRSRRRPVLRYNTNHKRIEDGIGEFKGTLTSRHAFVIVPSLN